MPVVAQVLHQGTTVAVPPPRAPRVHHVPSPTGWASTETIVEFIRCIDSFMNPLAEAAEPWFLVWDLCSVHTSKATGALIKDTFPHLCMAFVPSNSTGFAQPLGHEAFQMSHETPCHRHSWMPWANRVSW
eukprot:157489-Amphidinium_carterae.1